MCFVSLFFCCRPHTRARVSENKKNLPYFIWWSYSLIKRSLLTDIDNDCMRLRTSGILKADSENPKCGGGTQESEVQNPEYFGPFNKRVAFNTIWTRVIDEGWSDTIKRWSTTAIEVDCKRLQTYAYGILKTYSENSKSVRCTQESEVQNPVYFGTCKKGIFQHNLKKRIDE